MSGAESVNHRSNSPDSGPLDSGGGDSGLAKGVLSTGEVLAQSIANIAPSYGAALTIALIAGTAGRGAWLTWALATVVFLIVGVCFVAFARRYATAGSLYSFVSIGLGARSAFVVGIGWIAIVATGPVLVMVFGSYGLAVLHQIGIPVNDGTRLAVYLIGILAAAYVSYRGIQLSTRTLLIFELISMTLIVLLLIVVIARQGNPFDTAQLTLRGASVNDIFKGLVLAAFAFGGFESAAALGVEARDPRRQVPAAVLGSTLIVGLFFIFNAYAQAYGFDAHHQQLATSMAPLSDLATFAGLGSVKIIINLGIVVSAWSCMLANFNHGSRMLLTLSRDRALPSIFARSHKRHMSPHIAVLTFTIVWSAALIILVATAGDVTNWENWLGTFQGYIYILGYVLVGVASAAVAARAAKRRPLPILAGLLAAGALVVVLEQSVVPLPAYPFNLILYIFLAYIVLALGYFSIRARQDRGLAQRIVEDARKGEI